VQAKVIYSESVANLELVGIGLLLKELLGKSQSLLDVYVSEAGGAFIDGGVTRFPSHDDPSLAQGFASLPCDVGPCLEVGDDVA